ncbi:MAG TPA: M28 family peptidase [Bacteroidales bacterium]|nr:M28 family peptidase [Bacteroidales bacterium]
MKNEKIYYLLLCVLMLAYACESPPSTEVEKTSESIVIPSFDADSAYRFVENQVSFGPRVPNSQAHKQCGNYLVNELKRFCDSVIVQSFSVKAYDGTLLHAKNIIGIFEPQQERRILLGAHWDSRPYADHDPNPANHRTPIDGANDGASGVGVLLEIARQLNLKKANIGVDIIFFDVEDYGAPQDDDINYSGEFWCLGSQHWGKYPHTADYQARFGILLDMVGGKNAIFTREGTSLFYAPDILSKVWNIGQQMGYDAYFKNMETPPITDDHLYINRITNIPMIDIIEYNPSTRTGFNQHWHTLNDNLSNIDKKTLEVVGKVTLAVIYNEK